MRNVAPRPSTYVPPYQCQLRVENHAAAGDLKRAIQVLSQIALDDMDDSDIVASEPEDTDWKDTLIRVYLFVC